MSDQSVNQALGAFYREWENHVQVLIDRSQSFNERAASFNWINRSVGDNVPLDDLERVTDELLAFQ